MQIRNNLWIKQKKNGEIYSSLSGTYILETNPEKILICKRTLSAARSKKLSEQQKNILFDIYLNEYNKIIKGQNEEVANDKLDQCQLRLKCTTNLINFFKDFEFEPNFRFINTIYHHSSSVDDAIDYIYNYFCLSDNQYKEDIAEKMKSHEFKELIKMMNKIKSTKQINKRFKIYYGPQGAGKTTIAMKEADNNVVVCHSATLPSDLLEDFGFDDGKASFNKSILWKAMEEGKAIVLDEINLLPFESIRFLQGITDDKSEIIYKGHKIIIKEGFQIIGTMNLTLAGSVYGLPEPLVDRAYDIKRMTVSPKQLCNAF